jgi:hypothetical protein
VYAHNQSRHFTFADHSVHSGNAVAGIPLLPLFGYVDPHEIVAFGSVGSQSSCRIAVS